MQSKITVLGVELHECTAKKSMQIIMDHMKTEPLSVVEMLTIDTLMQLQDAEELKEALSQVDLVLPGNKEILEAAEITDRRKWSDLEEQTCLRLLFQYLHKNHCTIFALVESDEQAQKLFDFLSENYKGIQVAGLAKMAAETKDYDRVVNAVNGAEVDCVISALDASLGLPFVATNKEIINARVWIGVGHMLEPFYQKVTRRSKLFQYLLCRLFKWEIKKNKKEPEEI